MTRRPILGANVGLLPSFELLQSLDRARAVWMPVQKGLESVSGLVGSPHPLQGLGEQNRRLGVVRMASEEPLEVTLSRPLPAPPAFDAGAVPLGFDVVGVRFEHGGVLTRAVFMRS